MKNFGKERVLCCQNCKQVLQSTNGWAPSKMHLCYAFLYIVATPQLHHAVPGMLPPQGMPVHSHTLSRLLLGYYSDCISLAASAAAATSLYDIPEMLQPLWLQRANETVEDWPVKFSALVENLQQHGFCSPSPTRQIFSINKNSC